MRCAIWVLVVAGVLGSSMPVDGQTARMHASAAGSPAAPGQASYAGEPMVVERWGTVYSYNPDGTGSKVDTEVMLAQSEAGARSMAVLTVPYAAGRQRVEVVYVRVHKRNGAVIETPPGEAQDEATALTKAAPAYSEVHLLRLGVRGLAAGDRLEYEVRTVSIAAQAKDAFWGAEVLRPGRVVLERTVEVRVPAGTYVAVRSRGPAVQSASEDGNTVYRWNASQKAATVKAAGTGSGDASAPGAALLGGGDPARLAWTSFRSWAAVGEWYRGQMGDRATPTAAIQAKADVVVYRARTADAKIVALYDYMASEVRSIDVGLGAGGYQPQPAAEVFANQYGDSQDKHVLFAAMLRAENLPASAVLAGTSEDLDEEVPAPFWFERVLTLSHDAAHGDVWLDPTPEFAPYRMLQGPLRGKLALVIPSTGAAELRRTPADAPFPEYTHFVAEGTLSAEGVLKAHMDLTLRGDEELRYREVLHNGGPSNWDQVAAFYLRTAGLPGEPTNAIAEGVDTLETPLRLGFDYTRGSYGDWANFRIFPAEPGMNLRLTDRKTAPAVQFSLGGKRTETAVSRLTLPPGFSADLPPAVHLHTAFAALDKTYRLERAGDAQALVTERTLVITEDSLPATAWPEYRSFLDEAAKSEPSVQLTSTVARTGPGHYPPGAGENRPAAASLVYEAGQAVEADDWNTATARLDQAKAINPRQARLWSEYAEVALRTGKPEVAVEDYTRELKEHPGEGDVSRRLAALLVRSGRAADAVAVLRAAVAANPKDEASGRSLIDLLLRTDPAAAEKTARAGAAASPESYAAKLELGRVLLQEGKRDEAAGLLSAVATGSDDPGQLNDAAYELAEARLNLRAAEGGARRALQMLNIASASGLNGATGEEAVGRSAQLIAAWDTYGWVLYQEGSTSEAEPWLRAAWVDGLGVTAGMHYGKLLAKQGRGAEASRVQALAAWGTVDEAAGGTVRARGAGKREASPGAAEGERSVAVPRPGGGPGGTALFDVDYALGFVTGARFVRGEASLAGMADTVARVDTHTLIPPGSAGHLVRRGELTCAAGAGCRLGMVPASAAFGR